jgi:hypothetical protein
LILGVSRQLAIPKRDYFRIGEMVSVGSTNTYNLLPTDTKNCFCSSFV